MVNKSPLVTVTTTTGHWTHCFSVTNDLSFNSQNDPQHKLYTTPLLYWEWLQCTQCSKPVSKKFIGFRQAGLLDPPSAQIEFPNGRNGLCCAVPPWGGWAWYNTFTRSLTECYSRIESAVVFQSAWTWTLKDNEWRRQTLEHEVEYKCLSAEISFLTYLNMIFNQK